MILISERQRLLPLFYTRARIQGEMMKKIISFMLILAISFSMAACGGSGNGNTNTDNNTPKVLSDTLAVST